jgi:pyruvate/2-oxoglutarate dehydrogenase complex dihydrolipoamide acyltransferase (E2) component
MRTLSLVLLAAVSLAACDAAEPPKPAAVTEPVRPMVQAPAPAQPPAPAAAPQPSPDEALAARVRRALAETRAVSGQGVEVTAKDGVVTLFGTVPEKAEGAKVEKFVAGLDGVRSVVSKLVVVRGS